MIIHGTQKAPYHTMRPVTLESSFLWDLRNPALPRQATSVVPGFQAPGKYKFISIRAGTHKLPPHTLFLITPTL